MRIALLIGGGSGSAGVPALVAAMRRRGWAVIPVALPGCGEWLGPALLAEICGGPVHPLAGSPPAAEALVVAPDSPALADLRGAGVAWADEPSPSLPVVRLPTATSPDGPSLAHPEAACEAVAAAVTPQTLAGKTVLLTAGPTCEDLDPVRFLTNRSSGLMGVELALAAWRRGASVCLVHGPLRVGVPPLPRLTPVPVRSAGEMHAAAMARVAECQVAILCAAVADFTPAARAARKIKKAGRQELVLELVRTPDILAAIGALPQRPLLVGFAAETHDVEAYAAEKLRRKNCDLLCANNVAEPGSGFAVSTNRITLFARDGSVTALPLLSKDATAERILDAVAAGLATRAATP